MFVGLEKKMFSSPGVDSYYVTRRRKIRVFSNSIVFLVYDYFLLTFNQLDPFVVDVHREGY